MVIRGEVGERMRSSDVKSGKVLPHRCMETGIIVRYFRWDSTFTLREQTLLDNTIRLYSRGQFFLAGNKQTRQGQSLHFTPSDGESFTVGLDYLVGSIIPLLSYLFIQQAFEALIYLCVVTGTG